jgi:hypothetical protein
MLVIILSFFMRILPTPNRHYILGFICVDCDTKNKFTDELYSSAILEGVADGLYDIIEKYKAKNN